MFVGSTSFFSFIMCYFREAMCEKRDVFYA